MDREKKPAWEELSISARPTYTAITIDSAEGVAAGHPEQAVGAVDADTFHFSVVDLTSHIQLDGLANYTVQNVSNLSFEPRKLIDRDRCVFSIGSIRPAVSIVSDRSSLTVRLANIETTEALTEAQGTKQLQDHGAKYHDQMELYRRTALEMEANLGVIRRKIAKNGFVTRPNSNTIENMAKLWAAYSGAFVAEVCEDRKIPVVYFSRNRDGEGFNYHPRPVRDPYTGLPRRMGFTAPGRRISHFVNNIQLGLFLRGEDVLFSQRNVESIAEILNQSGDDPWRR